MRAVVTDKRGQPITDLKQEDFELMENGKPQELSFFSVVKIPGRGEARQPAAPPSAAAPSGVPAGATRTAETIGRSVLLYVDTLHLDERLTDQDLAAIVTSAGSLGVVEQFTLDHKVLRHAVDRLGAWPSDRNSLFTPYIAAAIDRGDREALQVATAIYAAENPPYKPSDIEVKAYARQVLSKAEAWLRVIRYQTQVRPLRIRSRFRLLRGKLFFVHLVCVPGGVGWRSFPRATDFARFCERRFRSITLNARRQC